MSIVYFWPIQFWGEAQIPATVTQEVVALMGAGQANLPFLDFLRFFVFGIKLGSSRTVAILPNQ